MFISCYVAISKAPYLICAQDHSDFMFSNVYPYVKASQRREEEKAVESLIEQQRVIRTTINSTDDVMTQALSITLTEISNDICSYVSLQFFSPMEVMSFKSHISWQCRNHKLFTLIPTEIKPNFSQAPP